MAEDVKELELFDDQIGQEEDNNDIPKELRKIKLYELLNETTRISGFY